MRWWEWLGFVIIVGAAVAVWFLSWHFVGAMDMRRRYDHHHRRGR